MTIVGGFDVHREQITFDYVDGDGLVHWGRIRPATRSTLRRWLAEHCSIHEALRRKFKAIAVPEGLREQIVSERRARFSHPLRRKAPLLAVAAALFLLLIGITRLYLRPRDDTSFSNFISGMSGKVQRLYPAMDLETSDMQQIRRYLAKMQARADYILPAGLQKTTVTGCAAFSWFGKRVSMVCFNSGTNSKPKTPDLYLFVIDRSDLRHPPAAAEPQPALVNGLPTASWRSGNNVYVLAGSEDEASLRKYY